MLFPGAKIRTKVTYMGALLVEYSGHMILSTSLTVLEPWFLFSKMGRLMLDV